MARPPIPPPPSRQPPRPADGDAPGAAVLELELSHPIKVGVSGTLTRTLRFARPPGLGEVEGWLDESSPDAFGASLSMLPFRPAWQVHVLSRCASVSVDEAKKVSVADLARLGEALAPFFAGSRPTGEEPSGS